MKMNLGKVNNSYLKQLYELYPCPDFSLSMDDKERWLDVVKRHGDFVERHLSYLGIKVDKDVNILSVSCGTGTKSIGLALKGAKIVSCDFSQNAINKAVAIQDLVKTDVDFRCAAAEDFVPEKKFQIILFIGSIQHLEDPFPILEKYAAYLEDGGKLVINTYSFWGCLSFGKIPKYMLLRALFGDDLEKKLAFCKKYFKEEGMVEKKNKVLDTYYADMYCNQQHFFTHATVKGYLEKMGLKKIKIYPPEDHAEYKAIMKSRIRHLPLSINAKMFLTRHPTMWLSGEKVR